MKTLPKTLRKARPTTRPTTRGISLVEAMVVLAVMAVLASSAAPGIAGMLAARRLDGVAAQLATDLQFVRTDAVARNQPVRVSFLDTPAGSCYVIHTGAAGQCGCPDTGPAICSGDAQPLKTVQLPAREQIAIASNAASVLFDPLHGTASPTATVRVTGAGGRAVHHVVNVLGRVRSCSPNAALPGLRAC